MQGLKGCTQYPKWGVHLHGFRSDPMQAGPQCRPVHWATHILPQQPTSTTTSFSVEQCPHLLIGELAHCLPLAGMLEEASLDHGVGRAVIEAAATSTESPATASPSAEAPTPATAASKPTPATTATASHWWAHLLKQRLTNRKETIKRSRKHDGNTGNRPLMPIRRAINRIIQFSTPAMRAERIEAALMCPHLWYVHTLPRF